MEDSVIRVPTEIKTEIYDIVQAHKAKLAGVGRGSRVEIKYEGKPFEVVVIDPNGVDTNIPTVGFSFRTFAQVGGVPTNTLSQWVQGGDPNTPDLEHGSQHIVLPSGKRVPFHVVDDESGNESYVIEASEWLDMAVDLLLKKGKLRDTTLQKLADFIKYFAVKGFYAEAYVALGKVYDKKLSNKLETWMRARVRGIYSRKEYTDKIKHAIDLKNGATNYYPKWTNYIYRKLFNYDADEMRENWNCVAGDKKIARNYIDEATGLKMVQETEDLVVRLYNDDGDLETPHELAVSRIRKRYATELGLN